MTVIATINDEQITADDFVKFLKFSDKFNNLLEDLISEKLAVHEAKKQGISVSEQEVQARVDDFRRINGLHRAKDTIEFIEGLSMSVDDFGRFIEETVYSDIMNAKVKTPEAVDEYFKLHSPKFESVELYHMLLGSEGITREILALLEDDPDMFSELARQHSMDKETAEKGGSLGQVFRGSLVDEIESKVFSARDGDLIGPFSYDEGLTFEIFYMKSKYPAKRDVSAVKQIHKQLFEDWLEARAADHKVEVL